MEVWRDIKGFEGMYQVSNYGNVRSLLSGEPTIIAGGKSSSGYHNVTLRHQGERICMMVHRLVAQNFIPNPNSLPCVNHKDEVKTNNHVNNLEWCTYKYNANYGTSPDRISNSKTNRCEVFVDGTLYPSLRRAERLLGMYKGDLMKFIQRGGKNYKGHTIELKKEVN